MENYTVSEGEGNLIVNVSDKDTGLPIKGAAVVVTIQGQPEMIIDEKITSDVGKTDIIVLPAPSLDYSQQPGDIQPYAQYTITVSATGYEQLVISGSTIFSGETSIQSAKLAQNLAGDGEEDIVIGANTLYGNYPAKIPESEVQPVNQSGEIVLSRVVIPETIIVHDGVPTDDTATNYYVPYKDYIKNVASSEIYSTWPTATIEANVLAIMSFTLNRVYTEFYRNKGYDFTITSSTAYDHKWIYGRNIFTAISDIVDEIFNKYLSRPNIKQPVLTQYCDGKKVSCPGWMSQWGSKYLGEQGLDALEILRYYYGSDIYINTAEQIDGIPSSWPGGSLDIGSSGSKVRQMQEQLATIARFYPAIPVITADGIYGERTAEAVRVFQQVFDMPVTGVVDFATWYEISEIYVAVTRIAELN